MNIEGINHMSNVMESTSSSAYCDRDKGLTMLLKIPGLMRFISLATWKMSTEPSASSWRVRDNRAQNVPAVTPPTLEKRKMCPDFHRQTESD